MDYFEASIEVNAEFAEILIAELAEIGFDTFLETETGIQAYVPAEQFADRAFKHIMEDYAGKTNLFYSLKSIRKENWNAQWESSFEPITVSDKIWVRAAFHPANPAIEHEIVITPKMSFGTGHHETTSQVLELQSEIDHRNKSVLDVGTGTGILAIFAEKLGAAAIKAFDIDEWSVENTLENIQLNGCTKIAVSKGTIQDQEPLLYDIVLANINRNILLNEIANYRNFLKPSGLLIMSGFYTTDRADIEQCCVKNGLKKLKEISKNDWAAVVFSLQ